MKRYEATIKVSPIYGREGAGQSLMMDVSAGAWATAAARALRDLRIKIPNRVGRRITLELIRVQ